MSGTEDGNYLLLQGSTIACDNSVCVSMAHYIYLPATNLRGFALPTRVEGNIWGRMQRLLPAVCLCYQILQLAGLLSLHSCRSQLL